MRRSSALALTASLALGVIAPAQAATAATAASAHAGTASDLDRAALRKAISLGPDDGAAGVVAHVYENGQRWRGTSVTSTPASSSAPMGTFAWAVSANPWRR